MRNRYIDAGTVWPSRVWEQDENGLWYSHEPTNGDWDNRETFEEWLAAKKQERLSPLV